MNLIIFGATGTAGAEVVREALKDLAFDEVTAIVRRPLDITHPKLKVIEHEDYLDYSKIQGIFKNQDACIWCLGISQSQVSEKKYLEITYDYTMAAAKSMLEINPNITFVFLSGAGADSTETSRTLFAKVKGKTENALQKLGFKKFYSARPAGIQPIHLNKNTALTNKLVAPFLPIVKIFAPQMVITSVELAHAMLQLVKNGSDKTILENTELKRLAKEPIS